MATIETTKALLRKQIANKIAHISTEERKRQANVVFEKLMKLPAFIESKRISVFLSTSTELDTEPMVKQIFELDKKCFVPRYSKTDMQMVRLHSMDDWENLPLTNWNIKQPLLKEVREDALETGGLELIICPGVAFTRNGDRMGHGGGYYDKYLKKLKKVQTYPPATVGICFKEQILDEIPVTDQDVKLDVVLYAE